MEHRTLELHVSRRGRRRAPLAWDVTLCCSLTCTSCVVLKD
jgi:hypothetical protein